MRLLTSLWEVVERDRVERIATASPDELAPQLGAVVRGLLSDRSRHIRDDAEFFIGLTVLTENFKVVLGELFRHLERGEPFAIWLNLDMGSGKTHLLRLILYLLDAHGDLRYHKEILKEYYELGLKEEVVKHTAVLAIDLRTPMNMWDVFLPFFAESLRRAGEQKAADYVRQCAENGVMPEAHELARVLSKGTRIVVLVDELHHAILTYRRKGKEHELVGRVIDFVVQLINYLRSYGIGFAVLVASARRDYEEVSQQRGEEYQDLLVAAGNLLRQLGRIETTVGTRWLSVEEARQIILRRLGAKRDILHRLFDKFIGRVVKAESDIPQAQHLRSLIKAMAICTRNAAMKGHTVVTPASFSEEVLDALFAGGEGGEIATTYKSIYSQVLEEIEREIGPHAGDSGRLKELVKLLVNIVFTMSVTGRTEQLIEAVKAYKTGSYRYEELPAVHEEEITRVLRELGYSDAEVHKAFEVASLVPHIHTVRAGKYSLYFVVPVVSVTSVFDKMIRDNLGRNLRDREQLVSRFLANLQAVSGMRTGDDRISVRVVHDYRGLEESTKGLDPNSMHIIIYAEPELVKYIEEKVRGADSYSGLDSLIREWFNRRGQRDLASWLEEHRTQNMAIVIPVLWEGAARNTAKYLSILDAVRYIVENYLLPYVDAERGRLPKELRMIMEVELSEIHSRISERAVEAVRAFAAACSSALGHAYIYVCSCPEPAGAINCQASLKKVEVQETQGAAGSTIRVDKATYNMLVDIINRRRDDSLTGVIESLARGIASYANFVGDVQQARDIIAEYVVSELSRKGTAEVASDMTSHIKGTQVFYIPPRVVLEAAQKITEEDLRKRIGRDVVRVASEETVSFRVVEAAHPGPAQPAQPQPSPPAGRPTGEPEDEFSRAMREISKAERGVIRLVIGFDERSKGTMKTYLYALRNYIKRIEVVPGSG